MSVRAPRRIAALLAVPAVAAGVGLGGTALAAPKAAEPTYKGSALALRAQVGLAGSSILDEILPSLVTYPPGSTKSLLELPAELTDIVALKVLNASSEVKDGVLESNSHTAGLGVLGDLVTAKVINADCISDNGDTSGDSQIAGLTLAGTKIPVDAGPNTKIEIPAELSSFLSGGIYIDEQTETADGGLRVRALHINLVVAPAALEDALDSVLAKVREAAQTVKVALEEATGQTLPELIAHVAPATKKAEKTEKTENGAKSGAAMADKARGAQSAERAAIRAEAAAPQAAAQPQAPAAAQAPAAPVAKSDDAAVNRTEAVEDATGTESTDDAESTEDTESTANTDATQATEAATAEDAAAAARAERAEKGARAAAEVSPPAEQAQVETAPGEPAAVAPVEAAQPAGTPATATGEADSTAVGKAEQPAAVKRAAAPDADSDVLGALGVDIVVSQVECQGEPGVVAVSENDPLPTTGGNGNASRDIAVAGLGLLAVGSAAVLVARRRRGVHAA